MMDKRTKEASIILAAFVAIVAALAGIRTLTDGGYAITTTDILVGLIPLATWLVVTGRIRELGFGSFKVVAAIEDASNASVGRAMAELPVSEFEMSEKGPVTEIDDLKQRGVEVLRFTLGDGRYDGSAIQSYVDGLCCTLRYLVLEESDRRFFGIVEVAAMQRCLDPGGWNDLARWINDRSTERMERLHSFQGIEQAVHRERETRYVLRRMETLQKPTLPVIDPVSSRFVGIVERSNLVAGLLLDVTDRLENRKPSQGNE